MPAALGPCIEAWTLWLRSKLVNRIALHPAMRLPDLYDEWRPPDRDATWRLGQPWSLQTACSKTILLGAAQQVAATAASGGHATAPSRAANKNPTISLRQLGFMLVAGAGNHKRIRLLAESD
jgi:hypothetical protein